MKIEGTYEFNATQEQVWELFNDPKHLTKAIPGCERLEKNAAGQYDALLKIGIAAVKGTYTGKFQITDAKPPQSYRLSGEGSGSPGFVKGEAYIELLKRDGKTLVTYQGEVKVGGLIAGVGQRMISGISKMMLKQFFNKMKQELKSK